MKLHRWFFVAALAALFYAQPVLAQWQTPNYSVPIGRGSGTGFKFASPGTAGLPLVSNGASADPSFQAVPASGGGTGLTTFAVGDLLQANTTSTLARLAAVATGNVLISGGVGVVSSWGKVGLTTHVSGTLPVANGGTNCSVASGTCVDNISGFSSTGVMSRTGAGTYTFSTESALLDAIGSTRGSILYRGASGWSALTPGTSGYVLSSNGPGADPSYIAVGGTGTVTSVSITAGTGITQSGSPVTASGAITVNIDKASSANLEAGASNKVLTSDIIYDGEATITYAASQTFDFNTFLNGRVTLTGNITSLTCSNIKASQSGTITLVQDATGSRTMVAAWCSQFRWAGGSRGVLSTAANAIDALFYTCISTSVCYVSLGKAQAN